MYIWERPDWPDLTWDSAHLAALLGQASREQGRLLGRMQDLGFDLRREAQLNTLTEDVVRSSEIEGEELDSDQVRSSIARRLGMDVGGLVPADRDVEGVVEMMLDATTNYAQPLTADRLFGWHAALFPTGRIGLQKITVGNWRDDTGGPMQVVSGPIGRQKVHYEAPPAARVPKDMDRFLSWFEAPGKIDPLLISGLAHVWFVTIHPFDDGNGRIARAIADMALAHSEQAPNASTVCQRKSAASGTTITRCLNARRRAPSMLRRGRNGSFRACSARSRARKTLWVRCWGRRASGNALRNSR